MKRQTESLSALPGRNQNVVVISASATTSLNAEVCLEELGFSVQTVRRVDQLDTNLKFDLVLFDPESASRDDIRKSVGDVRALSIGKHRSEDAEGADLLLPITVQALTDAIHKEA